MSHKCRKCGVPLIANENTTQHGIDCSIYICRSCNAQYRRERNYHIGKNRPMSENKACSSFLGIHVAERVMSHVFKNVERMPPNNPGYDFICGSGYKIDVKSGCRRQREKHNDMWTFHPRRNIIPDYFLCLAFDNREDLNPEHIWLIPAETINMHSNASISETRLEKWDRYKLDMNKVQTCCNVLKGGK